ncbi:Thioredoxin-like fold domain-containing protein MRL7 homolog, chloroplastic [Linum perenne]
MPFLHTISLPKSLSPLSTSNFHPTSLQHRSTVAPALPSLYTPPRWRYCSCSALRKSSDSESASGSASKPNPKASSRARRRKPEEEDEEKDEDEEIFVPRKPRRGRRSEAAAVEDFVRDHLKKTFASIRQQEQDPELLEKMNSVMKERVVDETLDSQSSDEDDEEEGEDEETKRKKRTVVEEEATHWPLDADVGWGIRASEYFEQHPIKNVVGEDGFEIDWEKELDEGWVQEINCLEWESIAFHPSPLIVLVFERYNRATDNWKTLQELEKAAQVYWNAKDRLPPRTVKIDMNIERDLACALKVKECPQILFLRGHRLMYREKEFRTSEELVQMIAHFYYNAKRPAFVNQDARRTV